jgi:hypothetical protein
LRWFPSVWVAAVHEHGGVDGGVEERRGGRVQLGQLVLSPAHAGAHDELQVCELGVELDDAVADAVRADGEGELDDEGAGGRRFGVGGAGNVGNSVRV